MKYLALATALFATAAHTAEPTSQENEKAVGEKLSRAYALYQRENVVSLGSAQTQVAVGFSYTNSDMRVPGLYVTSTSLGLQTAVSRGFGNGVQASLVVPYALQHAQADVDTKTLFNKRTNGFADPVVSASRSFTKSERAMTLSSSLSLPLGEKTGSDTAVNQGTRATLDLRYSERMRPAFLSAGAGIAKDTRTDTTSLSVHGGIGFSLNYALNLGWDVDGSIPLGTSNAQNAFMLTTKVAYQVHPDFGVLFSVGTGLTPSAPNTTLGVTTVWSFK